jgi:hypothetical protein
MTSFTSVSIYPYQNTNYHVFIFNLILNTIAKAANLLQTIRQHKHIIEVQKPKYFNTNDDDFFELEAKHPMSEGFGFTSKSTRKGTQPEAKRFICPPTLSEMLEIVNDLRRQQ